MDMVMDNAKREWRRGSCIGKGSFGSVYLAAGAGDSKLFAVKTVACSSLSPWQQSTSMAALENEIQILGSLSSPYIVSYLGDDVTKEPKLGGECRNLHLEYMPGGTVARRRMDESEIKEYTRCVVRALHYLHTVAGVVHGDVKGGNVLVGAVAGVAKLADFGSSRRIKGGKEEVVGGTPLWMAPEVARGERQRAESDVWSVGCMVIEMVSGGMPWGKGWGEEEGEEVGKVMYRIGYGEEVPELPAGMSVEGRDFVGKCLRREVGERWSCEELLRHGFLRDGVAGPSPRSVFEWGSVVEFGDQEEEEEEEVEEEVVIRLVRERVRELAEEGVERGGWEMMSEEGWEVVRGGGEGECGGSGGGGDCCCSVFSSSSCSCSCSCSFSLCSYCCCWSWDGGIDFGDEWLRLSMVYDNSFLLLLIISLCVSYFFILC